MPQRGPRGRFTADRWNLMQAFLVRRMGVAANAAQLDSALSRLRSAEEQGLRLRAAHEQTPRLRTTDTTTRQHPSREGLSGRRARWIQSYALREPDGRFGMVCLFEADDAAALARHADVVQLPTHEIVAVRTRLVAREFAPTMVYLVRRRAAWRTAQEAHSSVADASRICEQRMPTELSWLHSYAVEEPDGRVGTVCFYQAVSPEALRRHAGRAGMPADEIVPVMGRVVGRNTTSDRRASGRAFTTTIVS